MVLNENQFFIRLISGLFSKPPYYGAGGWLSRIKALTVKVLALKLDDLS